MKDMEPFTYFLGLEVHMFEKGNFVSQIKYVMDLLQEYNLEKCIPLR